MAKTLADFIAEARARIQEVRPDDLDEMIEDHADLLIIDVRERDEFAGGHIAGALNIPRGLIESAADPANRHRVEGLCNARNRTVVVCCESGSRSALATDVLMQMGFEKACNLAGGINLWTADGFPVIKDS